MITEPSISKDKLFQLLEENYDFKINSLNFLPKGEASWGYVIEAKDNKYFLKIHKVKNLSSTRFQLLHDLHTNHGIQNINYPITTSKGDLEIEIGGYQAVLLNFIEGKSAQEIKFSDKHYEKLGKLLSKIHQSKVDYSVKENFSIPTKDDFLKIVSLLNDNAPNGGTAKEAWNLLNSSRTKIENELKETERLSSELNSSNPEFVLCHGEPSPGNIMVNDNNEVYLIDWDEPILAPKEKDLMFFSKTLKPFMQGYSQHSQDITINKDVESFYLHLWNINEVADFGDRLLLNPGTDKDNEHNLEGLKDFLDYSGLGDK